jgi:hypothetical protein
MQTIVLSQHLLLQCLWRVVLYHTDLSSCWAFRWLISNVSRMDWIFNLVDDFWLIVWLILLFCRRGGRRSISQSLTILHNNLLCMHCLLILHHRCRWAFTAFSCCGIRKSARDAYLLKKTFVSTNNHLLLFTLDNKILAIMLVLLKHGQFAQLINFMNTQVMASWLKLLLIGLIEIIVKLVWLLG